jgi:hypothetical protein
VIAVHHRVGLDRLQVRAGAGLGHGDGRDQLAGAGFRDPLLLLLFAAVVQQVGHDDVVVQREGRTGSERAALLLDQDGAVEKVGSGTAVLFRHGHAQEALRAGLAPQLARDDALFLPFHMEGRDFFLEKASAGVAEHLVFGRVMGCQRCH